MDYKKGTDCVKATINPLCGSVTLGLLNEAWEPIKSDMSGGAAQQKWI